jgi:glycerol-3-phosphate acyltransferase PlsY
MNMGVTLLLVAVIGYLVGSLPIGYILVYLIKGEDLRQTGSGRTGGTNAMRAAGLAVGVVTAITDLAKGAGAVWIARALIGSQPFLPWAEAAAAVGAVTGHNWSVFLGLRGGAGTMPNLGAAIALWPLYGLLVIPAGLAVMLISGYASLTSLFVAVTIAAGLSVRAALGNGPWAHACYGLATAALVVVALLPNIKRLRAGTERIVGPRAHARQQAQDAPRP